tara:strand:- start:7161 stop:7454 length:294 start_codon:yes stop_codon:yes gene_type:complete
MSYNYVSVNDKRASQKKKGKKMSSEEKKKKTTNEQKAKSGFVNAIIGLALLLVFGSVAFMTVVIWTGTDNVLYKWLTAPAAIFDLIIAFVAFSKIAK